MFDERLGGAMFTKGQVPSEEEIEVVAQRARAAFERSGLHS